MLMTPPFTPTHFSLKRPTTFSSLWNTIRQKISVNPSKNEHIIITHKKLNKTIITPLMVEGIIISPTN